MRQCIEPLEARRLLSSATIDANGDLTVSDAHNVSVTVNGDFGSASAVVRDHLCGTITKFTGVKSVVIRGTDRDDIIQTKGKTGVAIVIYAGGGDDYVNIDAVSTFSVGSNVAYGEGGNDTIHGGPGQDVLDGGDGNDKLFGGRGDDFIYGEAGDDKLRGGPGNDTLDGGTGCNILRGGKGDDTFLKYPVDGLDGTGTDFVHMGGNDRIDGGHGYDTIYWFSSTINPYPDFGTNTIANMEAGVSQTLF